MQICKMSNELNLVLMIVYRLETVGKRAKLSILSGHLVDTTYINVEL